MNEKKWYKFKLIGCGDIIEKDFNDESIRDLFRNLIEAHKFPKSVYLSLLDESKRNANRSGGGSWLSKLLNDEEGRNIIFKKITCNNNFQFKKST